MIKKDSEVKELNTITARGIRDPITTDLSIDSTGKTGLKFLYIASDGTPGTENLKNVSDDIATAFSGVKETENNIATINQDIVALNSEIATLSGNVTTMQSAISTINTDIVNIKAFLVQTASAVNTVTSTLGGLTATTLTAPTRSIEFITKTVEDHTPIDLDSKVIEGYSTSGVESYDSQTSQNLENVGLMTL